MSMPAAKIKAHELRSKGKSELLAQVRRDAARGEPAAVGGDVTGGSGSGTRLPSCMTSACPAAQRTRQPAHHRADNGGRGGRGCSSRELQLTQAQRRALAPPSPLFLANVPALLLPRSVLQTPHCQPSPVLCSALPQLKDLKQELGGLRVAKVTGGAPNKLSKM